MKTILAAALLALVMVGELAATPTAVTTTDLALLTVTSGTTVTEAAADVGNTNSVTLTGNGRDILIARNTHATTAYTVTISSVADASGRTGDITAESIPAGYMHVYGPFQLSGWSQTNGTLVFSASNSSIKFSVLRIK